MNSKIGFIGLIGLMLCGCMSNQELKDWGKRRAARMDEKEQQRKARAVQRKKEREEIEEEKGTLSGERKSIREAYIEAHPDLDELLKMQVRSGYITVDRAEDDRKQKEYW